MFWEREIETMDREKLEALQLERLQNTVKIAAQSNFYKKRFKEVGLNIQDIKTLDDIKKIPFTTKDDLRSAYPAEMICVPREHAVRIHASSGTTGNSTVIFYTKEDISTWTNLVSRCLYMAGMRSGDVFQNIVSYGLFTGGLGFHYGAENLGALVIPAGVGNTLKQISLIKDFHTSFIHITPSYALYLAIEIEKQKLSPAELGLKGIVAGAEPYSENTRKKLEEIYNTSVFNSYGLSEMNGPGIAFECQCKKDPHIWEDSFFVEIIDPKTGERLKDGETGEMVLTSLNRKGMPLLRYRTKDLTYIHTDACDCGRTHKRIGRIVGRSDDMMIVKGVNVFPSQIEHVLMEMPEVGNNYQIVIDRGADQMDRMVVKVEFCNKVFHGELGDLKQIREKIKHALKEEIIVIPEVELLEPNTLPHSEGKAKRVIDLRKV